MFKLIRVDKKLSAALDANGRHRQYIMLAGQREPRRFVQFGVVCITID